MGECCLVPRDDDERQCRGGGPTPRPRLLRCQQHQHQASCLHGAYIIQSHFFPIPALPCPSPSLSHPLPTPPDLPSPSPPPSQPPSLPNQRCRRPLRVCLCPSLPPACLPLPPHLSLLVLQHAAEGRSNPVKCTVSILEAVMERGRESRATGEDGAEETGGGLVVIACPKGRIEVEKDARVARALLEEGTVLLYPAEGARDVRELVAREGGRKGVERGTGEGLRRKITVVVLDGTWEAVRRMYASNKCLHALPTICLPLPSSLPASPPSLFSPAEEEQHLWLARPPIFTIRKEPPEALGKGGRSTAEAVALALFLLGEKKVAEVRSGEKFRRRAGKKRERVRCSHDISPLHICIYHLTHFSFSFSLQPSLLSPNPNRLSSRPCKGQTACSFP